MRIDGRCHRGLVTTEADVGPGKVAVGHRTVQDRVTDMGRVKEIETR